VDCSPHGAPLYDLPPALPAAAYDACQHRSLFPYRFNGLAAYPGAVNSVASWVYLDIKEHRTPTGDL